jgi:hypothetical protein
MTHVKESWSWATASQTLGCLGKVVKGKKPLMRQGNRGPRYYFTCQKGGNGWLSGCNSRWGENHCISFRGGFAGAHHAEIPNGWDHVKSGRALILTLRGMPNQADMSATSKWAPSKVDPIGSLGEASEARRNVNFKVRVEASQV